MLGDEALFIRTDGAKPQNGARGHVRSRSKDGRTKRSRTTIDRETYFGMIKAWDHASKIALPLNYHLIIRPERIDDLTPAERQETFTRTYNAIQTFLNRRHPFACIWSRESEPSDGSGEHLHMAVHLQSAHVDDFEAMMRRRFPEPGEIKLVRWDQEAERRSGKEFNLASYIAKACHQSVRYGRPGIPYRKSGPVFGRRAGFTRNLGPKAIEAYWLKFQSRRELAKLNQRPLKGRNHLIPCRC